MTFRAKIKQKLNTIFLFWKGDYSPSLISYLWHYALDPNILNFRNGLPRLVSHIPIDNNATHLFAYAVHSAAEYNWGYQQFQHNW